jgi:phosphoglycerate dehydrogenase-like enzyme
MKLLITELFTLPQDVKERFTNIGLDVDYTDGTSVVDPTRYDVVYGQRPFAHYPYDEFINLKFLQLSSAGTDHLPIETWLHDQVLISNAKGVYSAPIAEMITLSILMSLKQTKSFIAHQANSEWKKHDLRELGFLKILYLGSGNIAQESALRLKAFGPLQIALNTDGRAVSPFNVTGKLSEVHDYLRSADIVVNTLPLTPQTHHLIDVAFFEAMKPNCTFINIGRGKSVDESALIKALDTDQLAFVYLDVFEDEPLPKESPLWCHPKVFITPHNSGSGHMMPERNYALLINNLQHYLRHEPLENAL